MSTLKRCYKCGKTLLLTNFGRNRAKKGGVHDICKQCAVEHTREQRRKNEDVRKRKYQSDPVYRELIKRRVRESSRRNPHWRVNSKLRRYGITREQYDLMMAEQGGVCAICHKEMNIPAIDHDHSTGKVRGILCRQCNSAIGLMKDDAKSLLRAARYVTQSSAFAGNRLEETNEQPDDITKET